MPKQTIADQLKAAIKASGKTHYRIGHDAGVAPQIIDRFIANERDLRLATAARIADAMGLELRKRDA